MKELIENKNIDIETLIILKNEFKDYEKELNEIFKENFFKNGGNLYSDDFLENSDFIIIAKINNKVVAYMAVCKLTEKELDREYETYEEDLILEKSIVIKHLAVRKEYQGQKIGTKLMKHIKLYCIQNKIEDLYLWTTLDNSIAYSFYKKQGFHKMGDFYPDDGVFQGLNRISLNYDDQENSSKG